MFTLECIYCSEEKHFIQLHTLIYHKYIFFDFETSIQYITVYLHHDHLSEKNKIKLTIHLNA